MTTFFDPTLFERWDGAFIREDKVDESLRKLIPGAHISKGRYSYPGRAELRDLAWNHMDQNHRPFIHRTYGSASRIFIDKHASFSLTRFGRWRGDLPATVVRMPRSDLQVQGFGRPRYNNNQFTSKLLTTVFGPHLFVSTSQRNHL